MRKNDGIFWTALLAFAGMLIVAFHSIFDNLAYGTFVGFLKSRFGIEEGTLISVLSQNFIPLTAACVIISITYRISRRYHESKLSLILNGLYEDTKTVFSIFPSTDEEKDKWDRDISNLSEKILKTLNGRISKAELNFLVNGSGADSVRYIGYRGREHANKNYLRHLMDRLGKLIEKHG
ncbi:hypothetical protein IYW40_07255 [Methylocystis sp. H4A]|uniref:hypothetical protein n=1 Tax=Methylocystis sp. H4A TaxID=2785788 RepID=UPI0018C21388|nr:hypothetical protein [Methylocystis sp. H4A]MBG0801278.1 hypothetical protein [Methylocystis sp. H4A]